MFLRRRRFHLKLFHVEHRPGSFSFRGVRKHVPRGTVSIYARRLLRPTLGDILICTEYFVLHILVRCIQT